MKRFRPKTCPVVVAAHSPAEMARAGDTLRMVGSGVAVLRFVACGKPILTGGRYCPACEARRQKGKRA